MEHSGGAFQASINFLSDLDNICHRWDATAPVHSKWWRRTR